MLRKKHLFFTTLWAVFALGLPIPDTVDENPPRGWVAEPRGRGTLSIITSCVATLTLCVWTAIHPDVRPTADSTDSDEPYTSWERFKARLGWLIKALFTPDRVAFHAFWQWCNAKAVHKMWLESPIFEDKRPDHLGRQGAFFVTMGGLVDKSKQQLTQGMFQQVLDSEGDNIYKQLDKREIIDKGKTSTIAKVVCCFQGLWLVLQLGARKMAGLPMSLLELHVGIHILVAAAVYGFWWHKPQDVNEPIVLDLKEEATEKPPKCWRSQPLLGYKVERTSTWLLDHLWSKKTPSCPNCQRPESAESMPCCGNGKQVWRDIWQALAFYPIYAGLHATAWNSHSPTPTERWLWRPPCIGVGVVPPPLALPLYFDSKYRQKYGKVAQGINDGLCYLLKLIYISCSMFLLVESFISLRLLPAGAYKTVPWSNYIPHF